MTDNTQELDEIVRDAYRGEISWIHDQLDGTSFIGESLEGVEKNIIDTKQAILDWHNKQVEAELEALREEVKHEDLRTISQIITARIDKLKESK